MSFQVTTAFTKQYSANILHLSQQMKSKLRNAVNVESVTGEEAFFNQIIAAEAQEVTTRFRDSPQLDTVHKRRRVAPVVREWGDFVDTIDNVQTLTDPTNKYVQAGSMSMGRAIDAIIRDAATGTALTGKTGSVSTVLPTSQKVAVGTTNLTLAKLLEAKRLFWDNDVDLDDPTNKLYIAVTGSQIEDLLGDNELTSADFNTIRTLVRGEIDSFLGFEFILYNGLTKTGDNRTCFAWAKSGITLGINLDVNAQVTRRADKAFAWYAFAEMSMGATRMEEEKVVEITCDETKTA